MKRPEIRDDLALIEGYHSPQVDVAIRLNTNESPEPPPAALIAQSQRLSAELQWNRYPDRAARALRTALAQAESLQFEQVFAANASNEVLQLIMLAFGGPGRSVLVFEPTYALHSHIARLTGTEVLQCWRQDMLIDVEAAIEHIVAHRPAIVVACSPNNPTGIVEPADTIQRMLATCNETGSLLVMDEAYVQFAPRSWVGAIAEDQNLVVTRTFSKTWSMAGLRLGHCCGPSWAIEAVESVALPYHLDAFKQAIGTAALAFQDEMHERVDRLVAERERVCAHFDAIGIDYWPSGANFVLFRPAVDAVALWEGLLQRSILVRNCANWPGVDNCLRVTIGTPAENDAFCEAMSELTGKQ